MITVMSTDNDIALEDSVAFDLEITRVSPSLLVIGGSTSSGMLHQRISITIQDNDCKLKAKLTC